MSRLLTLTDVRDEFEDAMRGMLKDGYVRSDLALFAVWPDGGYLMGDVDDAWKLVFATLIVAGLAN